MLFNLLSFEVNFCVNFTHSDTNSLNLKWAVAVLITENIETQKYNFRRTDLPMEMGNFW